jgi:hypothetical protein
MKKTVPGAELHGMRAWGRARPYPEIQKKSMKTGINPSFTGQFD